MVSALMFGMIALIFFVIYQSVYEENKDKNVEIKKKRDEDRRID